MALSDFPRMGFDPFAEMRRMQSEMNRLFSGTGFGTARDFPPINIWLGDNSVVVTAELPGVSRDDVTLNLQDDVLTLEGKREPHQQEGGNWQRRERSYGSFSRAVQLPFRIDPDGSPERSGDERRGARGAQARLCARGAGCTGSRR